MFPDRVQRMPFQPQKISDLKHTLKNLEKELDAIQRELQMARRRPWRELWNLIGYRVLKPLSRISALPRKNREKFGASVGKRDPRRILNQSGFRERKSEYDAILNYLQCMVELQDKVLGERARQLEFGGGVKISVVMPVFNPDPRLLQEALESVRSQSYSNWELCIADDLSTNPEVHNTLRIFAKREARTKLVFRDTNGHISEATNSALELASGDYVALMDHDDLLHKDALLRVAETIQDRPGAKLIYSDEDKVTVDGRHYDPHFKPDWNRDLLYSHNYITHLAVCDSSILSRLGGLRNGFEGAQDYDLMLRVSGVVDDEEIVHIPEVLYHWRASAGSTVVDGRAKSYSSDAGKRALEEHLANRWSSRIPVDDGPHPNTYRARWDLISDSPKVSLIMPMRDKVSVSTIAVQSILEKTTYPNYELVIVDNGSEEQETHEWLDYLSRKEQLRVITDERMFNYSAINNNAVEQSDGVILGLINNDIEVITPDWLTEMVALAVRPQTGCVGAKLLYPDGRIQHAGVVVGLGGVAGHSHNLADRDSRGYFDRLSVRQEYSAVTGACLVVRREIYDSVGGLNDKDLAIAFNDVDFCLRVRAAGFRNCWTPFAELFHHESFSRGADTSPDRKLRFNREADYMKRTWKTHRFRDPAYNPNLSLHSKSFETALPGNY